MEATNRGHKRMREDEDLDHTDDSRLADPPIGPKKHKSATLDSEVIAIEEDPADTNALLASDATIVNIIGDSPSSHHKSRATQPNPAVVDANAIIIKDGAGPTVTVIPTVDGPSSNYTPPPRPGGKWPTSQEQEIAVKDETVIAIDNGNCTPADTGTDTSDIMEMGVAATFEPVQPFDQFDDGLFAEDRFKAFFASEDNLEIDNSCCDSPGDDQVSFPLSPWEGFPSQFAFTNEDEFGALIGSIDAVCIEENHEDGKKLSSHGRRMKKGVVYKPYGSRLMYSQELPALRVAQQNNTEPSNAVGISPQSSFELVTETLNDSNDSDTITDPTTDIYTNSSLDELYAGRNAEHNAAKSPSAVSACPQAPFHPAIGSPHDRSHSIVTMDPVLHTSGTYVPLLKPEDAPELMFASPTTNCFGEADIQYFRYLSQPLFKPEDSNSVQGFALTSENLYEKDITVDEMGAEGNKWLAKNGFDVDATQFALDSAALYIGQDKKKGACTMFEEAELKKWYEGTKLVSKVEEIQERDKFDAEGRKLGKSQQQIGAEWLALQVKRRDYRNKVEAEKRKDVEEARIKEHEEEKHMVELQKQQAEEKRKEANNRQIDLRKARREAATRQKFAHQKEQVVHATMAQQQPAMINSSSQLASAYMQKVQPNGNHQPMFHNPHQFGGNAILQPSFAQTGQKRSRDKSLSSDAQTPDTDYPRKAARTHRSVTPQTSKTVASTPRSRQPRPRPQRWLDLPLDEVEKLSPEDRKKYNKSIADKKRRDQKKEDDQIKQEQAGQKVPASVVQKAPAASIYQSAAQPPCGYLGPVQPTHGYVQQPQYTTQVPSQQAQHPVPGQKRQQLTAAQMRWLLSEAQRLNMPVPQFLAMLQARQQQRGGGNGAHE